VDIAKVQDEEVGDGTTSVAVLCGELLWVDFFPWSDAFVMCYHIVATAAVTAFVRTSLKLHYLPNAINDCQTL
jgi:hypothetical protein